MEREQKKLAVFDVDGTIFRKNLHFELISELVYMKVFPKEVKKQLTKLYGNWLNNEGTYEAYRDSLVKLYEKNIKKCHKKSVEKASETVASFNIKRIYIFTRDLIEDLKKDNYLLLAVSGSPVEIVSRYSKALGFDFSFGSIYEVDKNGFYTGRAVFEPTKDKGAVVKKFVSERKLSFKDSFGIGDTESDSNFLRLVDRAIAFNPNLNLKRIAEKENWEIVVEKKDVIYFIN